MDVQPPKPALLHLEQLRLREADAETARAVDSRLAQGAEERKRRLAALDEDSATILADYPPERVVPAICRRVEAERSSRARARRKRGWRVGLVSALVPALGVLVCFVQAEPEPAVTQSPVPHSGLEPTRLKGDPAELHVYRHRTREDGGEERLDPGAFARPGDLLQLGYRAPGFSHGVIVSLDGRGVVTLHHPGTGLEDTALERGLMALDHAYELDEAPDFERFVFVTGREPIDVVEVTRAAQAVAGLPGLAPTLGLPLRPELSQISFLLHKPSAR